MTLNKPNQPKKKKSEADYMQKKMLNLVLWKQWDTGYQSVQKVIWLKNIEFQGQQ